MSWGNEDQKKVVVKSKPAKKKGCGCLSCFLVALIVFVVVIGAGIGVGWYFGDKYTREYFDMSLKDCIGVAQDLRKSNEKKLVTNKFQNSDAAAFENSLKKQLFLKSSAPLNTDQLLDMILSNGSESIGIDQSEIFALAVRMSDGGDMNDEDTQNNAFISYIASLYSDDYMDKEALKNYSAENHDDYILNIKDVQLAAFLNNVLQEGLKNVSSIDALDSLKDATGLDSLEGILRVEQVIFYGSVENPHMKLTVSISPRDPVKSLLDKQIGRKLGFLVNTIFPKKIFLTVDAGFSEDASLNLYINNMNDPKMDRFYKLVNGIMSLSDSDSDPDIKGQISDMTSFMDPVTEAIRGYGKLDEVGQGKLKVDVLQAVISLSKMNEGKEENMKLHSSDIIFALKYLTTSSFEEAINPDSAWQDVYKSVSTGELKYKPADMTGYYENQVDFEQEVMDEIARKYPIGQRSFDDLMALFGVGSEGGGQSFMDWVDPQAFKELSQKSSEELKVVFTDRMLGAMFNSQLESIMGGEGALGQMQPSLYQIHIREDEGRVFMEAGIALNMAAAFGESGFQDILGSLLSTRMMITFIMEVTPTEDPDYVYEETSLRLNDLTKSDMDNFMNILNKLGLNLTNDEMLEQLQTPMRDLIIQMKNAMPGMEFKTSELLMDDVFSITVDKLLTNQEGKTVEYTYGSDEPKTLTGDELRLMLKALYEEPEIDPANEPESNPLALLVLSLLEGHKEANPEQKNFVQIVSFNWTGNQIEMIAELVLDDMFDKSDNDYMKLLGMEKLFVIMTFDLDNEITGDGGDYYYSTYRYNGLNEEQEAQFYAIIDFFNGYEGDRESTIDIKERIKDISRYLHQAKTALDLLGG